MRNSRVARRYAGALFALAREQSQISEVRSEIERLAALIDGSDELGSALLTPLRPVAQRKRVLVALAEQASFSQTVRRFLSFLIDRRRLIDFAAICDEFGRLADEASGLVIAEVVAANPLDERKCDRLRRALSQRTGREVRLEVSVDPALIGGVVAKVGDVVFDGSLRTQLGQLRANLMKGS